MIKHIRIASDLHLEGFRGRNPETLAIDFLPWDQRDGESVLVLAGDISSDPAQLTGFIQVCQRRFPRVLFIAGNHEYYRHCYQAWNAEMSDRFERYCPGLIFALGTVGYVELDAVRFIFGTLWGDGGPALADRAKVGYLLNDFRLISYVDPQSKETRRFTVSDMVYEHQQQKLLISEYLSKPFSGKSVVVTHHLPSRKMVSPRFLEKDGSDGANGGFVGECDTIWSMMETPDLFIFGHTHDKIDRIIWKTRFICNPTGYKGEWNNGFSAGCGNIKFIDLNDLQQVI